MTYTGRRAAPPEAAGRPRSAARNGAVGDGDGPARTSRGRDDRYRQGYPLPAERPGGRYPDDRYPGDPGDRYPGDRYPDRRPAQEHGAGGRYGVDDRYRAGDRYAGDRSGGYQVSEAPATSRGRDASRGRDERGWPGTPAARSGMPQRPGEHAPELPRAYQETASPVQDGRRPRGSRPSTGPVPAHDLRQRGTPVETRRVGGPHETPDPRGGSAAQPRGGRSWSGQIRQGQPDVPRPHDGAPRGAGPVRTFTGEIRQVPDPLPEVSRDPRPRSRGEGGPRGGRRDAEPRQSRREVQPSRDAEPRQSRREAQSRTSRPVGESRQPQDSEGIPRSRREARAREAGQLRGVSGSRSASPDSGEVPLASRHTLGRGPARSGPLPLSAPVQRIKALLTDWSTDAMQVIEERFDVDRHGDGRSGVRAVDAGPVVPGGSRARARQAAGSPGEDEVPSSRRRRDRGDREAAEGARLDRDVAAAARSVTPASTRGRGRGTAGTGLVALEGVRRLDGPAAGAVPYTRPPIRDDVGSPGTAAIDVRTSGGHTSAGRSRGAGNEGLRGWIERSRRNERPRPDADDEDFEDGPENDHRRQLLTSMLALGGLGVTGWVASHMAGEGNAGAVTSSSSTPVVADAVPAAAPEPLPTASQGSRHTSVMLGNGEIDGQHERVLDLVDELEDAMKAGQSRRRQALVLGDLVSWLRVHFAFEDALMDSYDLAGSTTHKAHHQAFLAQMSTFAKKFTSGTAELGPDVISMIRAWMKDHNSQDDLRLVNELSARGVPSAI